MNSIWIKHKKLCKTLVTLLSICLFIGIGRVLFQYYAQQTKFSGSIIGSHWHSELPPHFIIKDPNHFENETIFDLSAAVPENCNMSFSALTEEGVYFYLFPKKDTTPPRLPRIMCLTEDNLQEIPVVWPDSVSGLLAGQLYVYRDKFYLTFSSGDYRLPDKVYSIPIDGGLAKEVYGNLRLRPLGEIERQRDGRPIQYKDGLICIRYDDFAMVFVNDKGEQFLFSLPVQGAKLLKGWYEEDKSLLIWGENPNQALVVNLQGQVLFSLYRSWFLSTSCWNVYGNADNGILFREGSLVGYDYFPGFYGMDIFRKERVRLFDAGIYDTHTGNMIPLYWKQRKIKPVGWSKVDYDEGFFKRLMESAERHRSIPPIVDK
jgi:protein A15